MLQVVDYKRLKPGSAAHEDKGLLFVVEAIPGLVHSKDMTDHLKGKNYWASENRAWFRGVRDVLGDDIRTKNDSSEFSEYSRVRLVLFVYSYL